MGLGGMIAGGMAMGAGSAVGHAAVNSMMGGGSSSHSSSAPVQQQQAAPVQAAPVEQPVQQNPCQAQLQNFNMCLSDNATNIGLCQQYFSDFSACSQQAQGMF